MSEKQGLIFGLGELSRFVVRLSGTGSSGATIRVYLERHEVDAALLALPTAEAIGRVAAAAMEVCEIERFTGRAAPTVIT